MQPRQTKRLIDIKELSLRLAMKPQTIRLLMICLSPFLALPSPTLLTQPDLVLSRIAFCGPSGLNTQLNPFYEFRRKCFLQAVLPKMKLQRKD